MALSPTFFVKKPHQSMDVKIQVEFIDLVKSVQKMGTSYSHNSEIIED